MAAQNLLGELALEATQQQVRDTLNGARTPSGKAFAVGNARSKFRDGFASLNVQPESDIWTLTNDHPDGENGQGHIVTQGGDANGASYLRISMSPFVDNSSVWLTSKQKFSIPSRVGWGVSASQRILGQELLLGLAEADDTDPVGLSRIQPPIAADVPVSSAVVNSNSLTLNVGVNHPFRVGDRVIVIGAPDTRINVGPVYVTSVDATTIAVPLTLTNATYASTGAVVRGADPLGRANNAFGILFENATATQLSIAGRRNGTKPRVLRDQTTVSTSATGSANYADSFISPGIYEQSLTMDECLVRAFPADSVAGATTYTKISQSIPDEELAYRLTLRARNLDDFSKPIARIVDIRKTGTTTATVTTDRPHGLTTTSRVGIYGVRDQANFPNISETPVTSVPSATTFTVVLGVAVTSTNIDGGVVFLNHGLVNSPGATNFAVSNLSRSNNALIVTLNATASGFVPGEYVQLWGMIPGAAYENAYKVLRQSGATLELAAPGPNFTNFNTGGAIIRRTDYRVHFVRILDHTRHFVEILGGRGNTNDSNNAVPVAVGSSIPLNVNLQNGLPNLGETTETSTVLAANALYSGISRDIGTDIARNATRLKVLVRHLAGITPGSLWLEQSLDNSTFFETWRMPIPSDGLGHTFEVPVNARYHRWRFQNGATAQTAVTLNVRRTQTEGTVAEDTSKNLVGFHILPVAGGPIAANTTVNGPTLDLGTNHKFDHARLLYRSDVAGLSFVLEQSLDGVNWWWADGFGNEASAGSGILETKIVTRYVRARVTTGANAATLTIATMSLVSI